jgi:hypothetical protein
VRESGEFNVRPSSHGFEKRQVAYSQRSKNIHRGIERVFRCATKSARRAFHLANFVDHDEVYVAAS